MSETITIDGLDMHAALKAIVDRWTASGRTLLELCSIAEVSYHNLSRCLNSEEQVPKAALVWDVAIAAGVTPTVSLSFGPK